jgi:hypothetical protein
MVVLDFIVMSFQRPVKLWSQPLFILHTFYPGMFALSTGRFVLAPITLRSTRLRRAKRFEEDAGLFCSTPQRLRRFARF